MEGEFPLDSLYILPTMSRPSQEILVRVGTTFPSHSLTLSSPILQLPFLKTELAARRFDTVSGAGSEAREKFHTLESFAAANFRSVSQATVNSARQRSLLSSAGTRGESQTLWKHQRDPIRLPLLKSLIHKEELAQEAVMIFTAILKYMSDLPSRAIRTSNELTDQIFEGPLKHEILRDEVYCQIMKQLTANRNSHSEQRGWDLLWLATGLFPCSKNLMKDLTLFQKTHKVRVVVCQDLTN